MYQLSKSNILLIVCIVGFVVLFRLVPHPANFAPVGALALLGGYVLPKKHAVWLPLSVMAITDLIIGTHNLMIWTWGSFALLAILASMYANKHKIGAGAVFAGAVSGGLLFFALTNFGVWLQSGMYVHTFSGLVQCYVNALPFLRNTLLGDVFFASAFYAAYLVMKEVKLSSLVIRKTTQI